MRTLVVIPTYNERANLAAVIDEVLSLQSSNMAVLVVDDNSPDGTGQLADEFAAKEPERVYVMHRPAKSGLGSAYLQGFQWGIDAGFDAVCEMDADGQHDPQSLLELVAAVASGADLAIGSRRVAGGGSEGWAAHRDWMSRMAMNFTRLSLGLETKDVTAGFRCYSTRAATKLLAQDVKSHGYAFQEEATFWMERLGCRIVEVPIIFRKREIGESKLTLGEVMKFFTAVARLRWTAWRRRDELASVAKGSSDIK